jgi:expansin (peptidoglycan-binding protein)
VLYPVKLIVSSITGDRTVGLKKVAAAFDSVTSAPTGTYQGDSAVVAAKGDVIVVETNRSATGDVCSLNISPNIYAKILIDSINPGAHTIAIQMVLDPNCGYRSFLAGIPGK